MYEASADEGTRRGIEAAHAERAAAFAALARQLAKPFHTLFAMIWPQDSTRRWHASPQGCPAGQ